MGDLRIKDLAGAVVIAASSAARLHSIGDLWTDRHEFVSPRRRQSQRTEIRYRQRLLDLQDITVVEGLPTMTMERTIAGIDPDTIARRVAEKSQLGSRVAAIYLSDLSRANKSDLDRLLAMPEMQETMLPIAESIAKTLHSALVPKVTEVDMYMESARQNLTKSTAVEPLTKMTPRRQERPILPSPSQNGFNASTSTGALAGCSRMATAATES